MGKARRLQVFSQSVVEPDLPCEDMASLLTELALAIRNDQPLTEELSFLLTRGVLASLCIPFCPTSFISDSFYNSFASEARFRETFTTPMLRRLFLHIYCNICPPFPLTPCMPACIAIKLRQDTKIIGETVLLPPATRIIVEPPPALPPRLQPAPRPPFRRGGLIVWPGPRGPFKLIETR